MADHAFLDKGVILGYCFYTDTHHVKCRDYISDTDADLYATKQVEDIFQKKKNEIITKHRRDILSFIRWVTSNFSGKLTTEDIEAIQEGVNRHANNAWRYLLDYFDDKAGYNVHPVTKNLRQIARGLESRADKKNEELAPHVLGWIRLSSYPELRDSLSSLFEKDEEDYWITIDAHDLASNVDGNTELATNNPSDFSDETVKQDILDHTSIDSIRLVFVSRNYSP